MKRKIIPVFAISIAIVILLPILSNAVEIRRDVQDKKDDSIKPFSGSEIRITMPRRGWLHIFGRPILPYGKTVIIGSTLYVRGYAQNINLLECLIKDLRTGKIKHRQSKSDFGTGSFSFTFRGVKRGDYLIIVWEGAGFAPTAQDTLQIKVL